VSAAKKAIRFAAKNRLARGTNTARDRRATAAEYSGTASSMTRNTAVHSSCRLPRSAALISSRTGRRM
jgi:hypothetical protein